MKRVKSSSKQGFAVMSGVGKEEGLDIKALDSVDKYLNTKYGLVLNNLHLADTILNTVRFPHILVDIRRMLVYLS